MSFWPAEAKMSTGAPASICLARSPEAPKLKTNFILGFFSLKIFPISSKAFFRLMAAERVISWDVADGTSIPVIRMNPIRNGRTDPSPLFPIIHAICQNINIVI